MAEKKIDTYIKLQVPAGAASPSPPVGPVSYTHLTLPTNREV